jgi:chromosome segregation ATPase
MLMTVPFLAPLTAAIALSTLAMPAAMAQATGSLSGGKASGSIMTREELRTCMKQKEANATMSRNLEAERKALDEEKVAILAETKELQGGQSQSADANASIADINARTEALAKRIEDWNQRMNDLEKSGRSGPMVDRQKRTLEREKRELEAESAALEAERGKFSGAKADVENYNARAVALQERTRAWNERNAKAVKMAEDAQQERDLWVLECGNRRYLIDDEKAIKAGQ